HRSLKEIARAASVSEEELVAYNKWVRGGNIPNDRTYAIMVPVTAGSKDFLAAARADIPRTGAVAVTTQPAATVRPESRSEEHTAINGVPVIAASRRDSAAAQADRRGT